MENGNVYVGDVLTQLEGVWSTDWYQKPIEEFDTSGSEPALCAILNTSEYDRWAKVLQIHNVPVFWLKEGEEYDKKILRDELWNFAQHCKNRICHNVKRAALTVVHNKYGILGFQRADGKGLALPCGKIDGFETPYAAAVRELEEETGFVVSPEDFPYLHYFDTMASPASNAVFVYTLRVSDNHDLSAYSKTSEGFEAEGTPVLITPEEIAQGRLWEGHYGVFNRVLLWNFQQLIHKFEV